jgi:hypothetical protein
MFRFISFLAVCLLVAGCAGLPGHVSKTESMLDGERQVHVAPGVLYGGGLSTSSVQLGGYWSEKDPEAFYLDVVTSGLNDIQMLKVSIDGTVSEFSADSRTRKAFGQGGVNESSERVAVTLAFVRDMVAARRCVIQVITPREKFEGIFSFDQHTYARPAFRKALGQIESTKKGQP